MKYIFLFFVFPLSVWSQSDAGLQLFGSQWQGNNLLPVYRPAAKWTISPPGWQHNLSSNSLRYGDVITTNASGNPVVDVGKLLDHLKDQNALAASVRLQTFQLTHSNGPLTFSIGHQFRYWNRFDFPEALPKLIWEGNAQYIGQTVPFGFNLELTTFSEWSAGLAYSLNSNWTAGARLKYLSGIGHVGTSRSHLSLYTDPEVYQLTVDADFQVDAAGYFQYDDFDNLDFSYRFKGFEQIVYPGNTGFAADLGLSYSGDQWETNLSLVDLGNIQWKKDAESYLLKGQYAYDGLNVARDFFNDSLRLEDALDTLQNLFDVQTQAGAFKTALPARLIWNAQYNLSEQLALSAGFQSFLRKDAGQWSAFLGGRYQLLSWLNLGVTYSLDANQNHALGAHALLKAGPLQLVAGADHLPGVFNWRQTRYSQVYAGLALAFGGRDPEE